MPKLINRNTQRRPTPSPTNNVYLYSDVSIVCSSFILINLHPA